MSIAIITVTFNPNIEELKLNIRSYIDQVAIVIVVDNSIHPATRKQINELSSTHHNLKVIQFEENMGIAEAQNVGSRFAIDNGFEFVLEMDQDSKLPSNYVEKICSTHKILAEQNLKVAAIGPIAINERNNEVYDGLVANIGFYEVDKTLSSGLLVPVAKLEEIGLKDSKMFIDLVDWEWCWRAKELGYQTYIDSDVSIIHNLGEEHKKILSFRIGVAAPIRHYYAFRNSLYLFSKSYVPLKWKIKTLFLLTFKFCLYPFILSNGKERIKFMISGIKDYFKKNYGRYQGK